MTQNRTLNKERLDYPEWPLIADVEEKAEVIVKGDHVSFEGYSRTRNVVNLVTVVFFFHTLYQTFIAPDLTTMFATAGHFFFAYVPLVLIPFWSYLLPRFFYPCRKIVRFTPEGVIINGHVYKHAANVGIQFRADRSALSPYTYQQTASRAHNRFSRGARYALQFRVIEMVYGARIVRITTVADEDRAHQYALALQIACERAASRQMKNHIPSSGRGNQRRKWLLE